MEVIHKYFKNLTDQQVDQFSQLGSLYKDWNDKINVISRKDIDNLYSRHVLHALAIAKFIQFKPETTVLDLGTGGGFPAIPLAIYFPEVQFTAIDGTAKKIRVVNEVIDSLKLKNIKGLQKRAEEHKTQYEFVVTRAVAASDKLIEWCNRLIDFNHQRHALPNGIIALKGGNPKQELKLIHPKVYTEVHQLHQWMPEPEFEEKYLLYIQR